MYDIHHVQDIELSWGDIIFVGWTANRQFNIYAVHMVWFGIGCYNRFQWMGWYFHECTLSSLY